MFSYRHAFHAGNHADVLKHTCLVALMKYLTQKDTALTVIDTHAGAGLYRLDGDYTETGGEVVPAWNGPGGLWNIPWDKWLKKSALGSVTGNPDTTDPLTPGPGDSTDQVGA